MRLHPAHDISGAHGTCLARHFATVFEQCQGWNTANRIARAQVGNGLGVNLGKPHFGFQLYASLLVRGRHLATRTAPRRPKIDQYRNLAAANVFVKSGFVKCCRMPCEQRLLATAASGVTGELVSLDAIGSLAVRADDVQ